MGGLALAFGAALVAPGCGVTPPGEPESIGTTSEALTRSLNPPGGLSVSQVPQFVAVTFDDNFQIDGFNWAVNFLGPLHNPAGTGKAATFDGTSVRTSFYHNSTYLGGMTAAWQTAFNAGHELDDHTVNHPDGIAFTTSQWQTEINNCRSQLATAMGTTVSNIRGFRAPYLHYNDNAFTALLSASPAFTYDTSIMGCWATGEGPTNCPWPYTMDSGSADADAVFSKWSGRNVVSVAPHAGLWEMPVSVVFVPPDSVASTYGFPTGLRDRVNARIGGAQNPNFFELSTGKMVGMDITMVLDAAMSKAEALATLKYTLDQRLAGNRAPMIFVGHTHVYEAGWNGNAPNVSDLTQRRGIIQDFVNYALSKPDVRFRPVIDIVNWMKTPVPLGSCTAETNTQFCTRLGKNCGSVTANDNCGTSRTVSSCGTCTSPQTCGGGGTANVCGSCTAESNAQFCTRLGKNCGSVTANDNCGTSRTVSSCGTCTSPQTCGGGGTANVCGTACTAETNAQFCTRLGKNCGSVTANDNCGTSRTVSSCGTCTSPQTCGGGGTANVCGGGSGSCSPTVTSYTLGKCNATAVYNAKLYKCISQAVGVNGETTGCGAAGVYCSNITPTDPAWGTTAWQFVQNCP